jgi:pimeloyl-ACP methyl ester carboxylesterase
MRIALNPGETVHLDHEVHGSSGPDLVLIHGLGLSSRRTWQRQLARLAERYRVHSYDVRGFGASDKPGGPLSVDQHARDLLALLDALAIDRAVLIGFSMGGWISQQFVLDHPERVSALVLACTSSGLRPEGAERFVARSLDVEARGLGPLVDAAIASTFAPATLERDPELIAFYRREFLDEARNPPAAYAQMFRALTVPNWTAQLRLIRCPTLIVCGREDRGVSCGRTPTEAAQTLHHGIAGSQLAVLDGGGHYAHLERPELWNRTVLDFLDGLGLDPG